MNAFKRLLILAAFVTLSGLKAENVAAAGGLGASCNGNLHTLVITNFIEASVYLNGSRPPAPADYPSVTSITYPASGSAVIVDPVLLLNGASVYVVDQNGNTATAVCGNGPLPTVIGLTPPPTPTATPTDTRTPTNTPGPQTATNTPVNIPPNTPVNTQVAPSSTPVPPATLTEVPSQQPSDTPQPTATEVPSQQPGETPQATDTAVLSQQPADTLQPTATDATVEQPTETPQPTASLPATQAATGSGASLCVTVFRDANNNQKFDDGEALLPGMVLTLSLPAGTVGQMTSTADGASCFNSLSSGDYRLDALPPDGYTLTTTSPVNIRVADGSDAKAMFGALQNVQTAQVTPSDTASAATPTPTPTPAPAASANLLESVPTSICLLGILAIFLIGILLGYLVARRR